MILKFYFNYANLLHLSKAHNKVIDVCTEAIDYSIKNSISHNMPMFYYRIAIAFYNLSEHRDDERIIENLKCCKYLMISYKNIELYKKIRAITIGKYEIELDDI